MDRNVNRKTVRFWLKWNEQRSSTCFGVDFGGQWRVAITLPRTSQAWKITTKFPEMYFRLWLNAGCILLAAALVNPITSVSACNETAYSYLDSAVNLISKAKKEIPMCPDSNSSLKFIDCEEALAKGYNSSGVYTVWPKNRLTDGEPLSVYCDMTTDGGGWLVIQRRGNFSRLKDYFFKDWKSYKNGFGNIEEDFWIGNDYLFALTNQRHYSLRIDMKAVGGESRYALYDSFWIDDENCKYTLHIEDFSGDVGDSLANHNNQKFSTKDVDNDSHKDQNCAQSYKGGWWYNTCHLANLNGLYLRGNHTSFADGVNWHSWKGYHESLDTTEMKIRPKKFRKNTEKYIVADTPQ